MLRFYDSSFSPSSASLAASPQLRTKFLQRLKMTSEPILSKVSIITLSRIGKSLLRSLFRKSLFCAPPLISSRHRLLHERTKIFASLRPSFLSRRTTKVVHAHSSSILDRPTKGEALAYVRCLLVSNSGYNTCLCHQEIQHSQTNGKEVAGRGSLVGTSISFVYFSPYWKEILFKLHCTAQVIQLHKKLCRRGSI